jgi:tetratricopeptide (TPR) repeat protein
MEQLPMKTYRALAVYIACLLVLPFIVYAQGAGIEWDILNQEVIELYQAGKYDRAVLVAGKALEVAEQNVGPEHPDVATSLNNLALLYDTQGDYAKAEPLYKRAARIEAIER